MSPVREALRRSLLVLGLVTAVLGAPALLPEVAPSLPAPLWLGAAAADECAGVDPNNGGISVDPDECTP